LVLSFSQYVAVPLVQVFAAVLSFFMFLVYALARSGQRINQEHMKAAASKNADLRDWQMPYFAYYSPLTSAWR